jgi:predicted nucleotidyltransferase
VLVYSETKKGQEAAVPTQIETLIEQAAEALKAAGAREVYVFGSAARGKLREDSDIDLAVCGLPAEAFFRAMAKASRALGRPVDLVDLDEDNPFTRYLKEEGELQRVG